jgi:hypothetical protein
MKTLSSLLFSLTCVLGVSTTVSATPLKEPVSIEALEVYETSPEDYTFVCARYQGEATRLVAGKIKGIDFYPLTKTKVKRLQRRAQSARTEKLEQWFLRRVKKAQTQIKRCKQERRISPLVVEQFSCGHDLILTDFCETSNLCGSTRLGAPAGTGPTIAIAYANSQLLCENFFVTTINLVNQITSSLYGASINFREGDGCQLFGCGIVQKGFDWNIFKYSAIGTIVSCKNGNCTEEEVSGSAIEPSWDEARQSALQACRKDAQDTSANRIVFDGYTSSIVKVSCIPGLFSNFIGEK